MARVLACRMFLGLWIKVTAQKELIVASCPPRRLLEGCYVTVDCRQACTPGPQSATETLVVQGWLVVGTSKGPLTAGIIVFCVWGITLYYGGIVETNISHVNVLSPQIILSPSSLF